MLNSGETSDDLFDADGNMIDNCATGLVPTVAGFTLTADGDLSPINGSTRTLASPFGFTSLKNGALLTTEQFDGPNAPGRGGAAGY